MDIQSTSSHLDLTDYLIRVVDINVLAIDILLQVGSGKAASNKDNFQ